MTTWLWIQKPGSTTSRSMKMRVEHRLAVLFFVLCAIQSPLTHAAENMIRNAARQAEVGLDARVGLAIYDTGSGARWLHNADERFPMTSTFKVLACGALLARNDVGDEEISRLVTIAQSDLVTYSPVTEKWVNQEVSFDALCAATLRTSDNTAANKVLEALGGPDALTAFLRAIGDKTTRLDRWETELNEATPGDPRDTTTPAAMANSLQKLLLGDALSPAARETLIEWLIANEVGGPLLRAGVPDGWRIGDRTGAGGYGSRGIVAIVWPPERAPLIAAIYITQTKASMEQRNAAIEAIGKAVSETLHASP